VEWRNENKNRWNMVLKQMKIFHSFISLFHSLSALSFIISLYHSFISLVHSIWIFIEIFVEWMTEFQQVARIATWRPWNKQVVSEVTSWNETFSVLWKEKKNVVWWNKLKWLLNVFHHIMKLYCLGMGIKELSLNGSGSVWQCNKSNKVLQHSPVLLILYHILQENIMIKGTQ